MNQVLHHAEQPVEVFREISRVLEPNGVLALADMTSHQYDWTRLRLADQWLGFKKTELENWLIETGMLMTSYCEFGDSATQQPVFLLSASILNKHHEATREDLSNDKQS
jgi:ArsR family transcriptional regulator